MSVPNTVLYMSVYEKLKEVLMEDPSLKAVRPVAPALAGALARMVSVTIISPLELIRTIQTGGAKDSLGTIARSIVQKEGLRGMYRGER
jgi:solute carrier family 25 protein 39/40